MKSHERSVQEMLIALVNCDDLTDTEGSAFRDMNVRVARGNTLSPAAVEWVRDVFVRLDLESSLPAMNLVSRGLVPLGRHVDTPDVLRRPLPMKPPGRP